jgi:hypothetical protein
VEEGRRRRPEGRKREGGVGAPPWGAWR